MTLDPNIKTIYPVGIQQLKSLKESLTVATTSYIKIDINRQDKCTFCKQIGIASFKLEQSDGAAEIVRTEENPELTSASLKMIEIPDRDKFPSFAQRHMASGEKGVGSAYQSYKAGRSTNTATILLLGMTGAGKSHTINNLFTKEITPVGEGVSCTKDIVEFTIEMPSENAGISNAKIKVIDTPGFGDTEDGLEFDARVLANIDRLFELRQYKPSFIILAVNINDKRLDGKFAPFVQLLQSMKLQLMKNVLDKDHPNLVIVLTHLCGAVPKLQRDPNPKKLLVQKIVHENLGIPNVPVEVAENCVDDYELPKTSAGDYFILPNKEYFPRNLYQSMVRIAQTVDPVGHEIVNEAYPKLQKRNFPISKQEHPIVEVPASDVIASDIMRMKISTNTELGDNLSVGYSQLSKAERDLCRMEPTEFSYKLSILGYRNRSDLPKTKKDVIAFFREISPDKGMEILLRKSFGLEAPNFTVDLYIGRAFDLTKDRTTSFVVLSPGTHTLANTGCYMPQYIISSCCPEVKFTCNIAHTAQEMMQQRMKELKIQMSCSKIGFNFSNREGYSIFSQGSSNTLTAVYEKRILKLEIKHNAPISQELTSAVEGLPTVYDRHNQANVQQWKTFFNTYGTHYINTSYLGGSVVFTMSNVDGSKGQSSFQSTQGGISGFLKGIFGGVEYSDSSSSSSSSSFSRKNMEILVRGGNSAKASQLALSNNQKEFTDRLTAWEETIWENPMVTDSSVALAEVADVVNQFRSGVVNAMKVATEDLYNARLEYEAKLAEPTKQGDSDANKGGDSSCLTPETLISTPRGNVPVKFIQAGDIIIDQYGRP
ncbi:unnamed protein product, partial [Allacma fusca]